MYASGLNKIMDNSWASHTYCHEHNIIISIQWFQLINVARARLESSGQLSVAKLDGLVQGQRLLSLLEILWKHVVDVVCMQLFTCTQAKASQFFTKLSNTYNYDAQVQNHMDRLLNLVYLHIGIHTYVETCNCFSW